MNRQKVAGTVLLNLSNGEKRFLLMETSQKEKSRFVTAVVEENQTNLSSILETMKNHVNIDTFHLTLLDLTKITVEEKRMPFFVFELSDSAEELPEIAEAYFWGNSIEFRENIQGMEVTGVPVFC